MILEENIKKLNVKYGPYDLKFKYQRDKGRIIIFENFVINKNKALKNELKTLHSISFDWDNKYWFIGEIGIKNLSKNIIKVKPSELIEVLKVELSQFIKMIKDERLRESLENLLKNHPEFYEVPCAVYHHHKYIGGLLEHTIQTCKISLAISNTIGDEIIIDKDLLIAGSILHDVGKINCYKYKDSKIEVTEILREQEHIINGIKIVSQELDIDKLDDLIHIIASHHNIKDWGSPVQPYNNEAWIIHFSENLSSKILG